MCFESPFFLLQDRPDHRSVPCRGSPLHHSTPLPPSSHWTGVSRPARCKIRVPCSAPPTMCRMQTCVHTRSASHLHEVCSDRSEGGKGWCTPRVRTRQVGTSRNASARVDQKPACFTAAPNPPDLHRDSPVFRAPRVPAFRCSRKRSRSWRTRASTLMPWAGKA